MKAILQRVAWAEVDVGGETIGRIAQGLLVYIGVRDGDGPANADALAAKVAGLRIFCDAGDKLNLSVRDIGGEVLVIPNFTLLADARKGRRPSFAAAAKPSEAEPLQQRFVEKLSAAGVPVSCGQFGADMTVRSAARGPVNILVDHPPGDGP